MNSKSRVYNIVAKIPAGFVLTYGAVAKLAEVNSPRAVGTILHKNTDSTAVPCHRVVNAKGQVAKNYAFGGSSIQRQKLESEGVTFAGDKVDLKVSLWRVPRS